MRATGEASPAWSGVAWSGPAWPRCRGAFNQIRTKWLKRPDSGTPHRPPECRREDRPHSLSPPSQVAGRVPPRKTWGALRAARKPCLRRLRGSRIGAIRSTGNQHLAVVGSQVSGRRFPPAYSSLCKIITPGTQLPFWERQSHTLQEDRAKTVRSLRGRME